MIQREHQLYEKIASFGKLALLNNSKEKRTTVQENLYYHKGSLGYGK